jgi:hypothetical protein
MADNFDAFDDKKKDMLHALEASLNNITKAAEKIGITRQTHYNWMAADPVYKKAAESIDDVKLDFVEEKLKDRIMDGDTTAIIFYLKTKGKKRGYIERQELTGADGKDLNTYTVEVINKINESNKDSDKQGL